MKLRNIKNRLGLCTCKRCLRKANYEIEIPLVQYSGNLCDKHLNELIETGTLISKEVK
ncbi:hypothetical protein [Clostridium sp. HBUAS56017]|uniref:hypothetical protein n=1 Tax=Clostridium sp. HBUAS56017 TaxID=2571128 RepID=UPI00163DC5BF|nr:hypothetical protein [Clostridium sp. HBUAS56017]